MYIYKVKKINFVLQWLKLQVTKLEVMKKLEVLNSISLKKIHIFTRLINLISANNSQIN